MMVREVPPPPVEVSSWGINDETAVELFKIRIYFTLVNPIFIYFFREGGRVVTCFLWFLLFR